MVKLQAKIDSMKQDLSIIVQNYGYKTVKEFITEYKAAKTKYSDYKIKLSECQNQEKRESIKEKLKFYQMSAKEQNRHQSYLNDGNIR